MRFSPGLVARTYLQRLEEQREIWALPSPQQFPNQWNQDIRLLCSFGWVLRWRGSKKSQMAIPAWQEVPDPLNHVATDSQFQFSIDGHKFRVIVEANAPRGDYWLRAFWVNACAGVADDQPS